MNCYQLLFEGSFDRKSGQDVEGFFTTRYAMAESLIDAQNETSETILVELREESLDLFEALLELNLDEHHIVPSKDFRHITGFTFF